MGRVGGFFKWFFGALGAVVLAAAQIKPDEAISNVWAWADRLTGYAPAWLGTASADNWATAIGLVLLIAALALWLLGSVSRDKKLDNPNSLPLPFRTDGREPVRDKSLTEAAIYAVSGQWGFGASPDLFSKVPNDPRIAMTNRAMALMSEIQQRAYDGNLTIWGRPYDDSAAPLQVIPTSHWITHSLHDLGMAMGQPQTRKRDGLRMDGAYVDLMVSREEFEREWPHAN